MFSGSTLCQANLGQGTFPDQEPSKLVAISVALCGDCENQRKVDLPCLTCHHRRDVVDRYKSTELLPQHPSLASLVVSTYNQAFIRTSWSFLRNKTDCPSTVQPHIASCSHADEIEIGSESPLHQEEMRSER